MPSIQTAAEDLDSNHKRASGSTVCPWLSTELCFSARCYTRYSRAPSFPGSEGKLASSHHSLSTVPLILQRMTNAPTHYRMPLPYAGESRNLWFHLAIGLHP